GELVLTGDVAGSLEAVLGAAQAGRPGAGFFVVGPFGSGKSHFLAAVGELLDDPRGATSGQGEAANWPAGIRVLAQQSRPSLVVTVPLVEYRAVAPLEDVVSGRAWRALEATRPGADADDRTRAWDGLLAAAVEAGHDGVVLLLDELSEFLRAKQGPALTEDLRFLQFLGEWAQQHPVVVVAALQESIEEVANVSQRELARIRDRYRPSVSLSMRHVEDLVHGRLVRLRPGAERWVRVAHEQLSSSFPGRPASLDVFARCYPLHPETLSLLEGLRFLLSQQRGVVDFVCRGLRDALDRPCTELVTPDRVYDHFAGRLHERQETSRFAGTVVAYYERALGELVDPEDRDLALRTVKLLCLLAASPLERPRSAAELAGMLQARVSDIDPAANVTYLEAAVLGPLAERGAYLVVHPGPPATYEVDAGADATLVFAARARQVRAELHRSDRRLVSALAELGSTPSMPLETLLQLGPSRRELLWQNTLRALLVSTARLAELAPGEAEDLAARAAAIGAEGCLLIAEPELTNADVDTAVASAREAAARTGRLAAWVPAALTDAEHDTLLDIVARRTVLAGARRDAQSDLVEVAERAAEPDAALARELTRRIYFEGSVVYPPPVAAAGARAGTIPLAPAASAAAVDLPSLAGLAFERQLPRLAEPLLSGLHPVHRQVAPRGELVGERLLRQLVGEVIAAGRIPPGALAHGQVRQLVEGYLVPLGLATSRRDGAVIAPDPGRSPAVAELLRLVGDGGPVAATDVVGSLGEGPLGLSEPESLLVLNACCRVGLVEMTRGRRRMTEPFLAVTASDRLLAGELVEPAVRQAVAALGPVCGPGPFEPWTASTQRHAWQYAQAWIEARRDDLSQVQAGVQALQGVPFVRSDDEGAILAASGTVAALLESVAGAGSPAAGLRGIAGAVADPEAMVAASSRLAAVARFLREDLRLVEESAAYLGHPDLRTPAEDGRLGSLLEGARSLVADALRLAAEDRARELFLAISDFRSAYTAAYQDAHDRHYSAVPREKVEALRAAPAYRALARLATIGAIAVPDDRVKVDRALAGAAPTPCARRVDQELLWKPLCACGLRLGDPVPVLDREGLLALAGSGVSEYLAELLRPELRERLEAGATDLDALGRTEMAANLRRLINVAGEADPDQGETDTVAVALTELIDDDLARTIGDLLTGSQLIVTRDLAVLREDLIGRRYPKQRLLELVARWADPAGDVPARGFIEIVDRSETPAAGVLAPGSAGTAGFLRSHFPSVAAQLPAHKPGDAFWLAAWWDGRPDPPSWLPAALLSERECLAAAAGSAPDDPAALAELADLDRRSGPGTVLGDQIAAALDLPGRSTAEVLEVLAGEKLLRQPVRLASDQLLRRLGADWLLAERADRANLSEMAAHHALVETSDVAPLQLALEAARRLAQVERRLGTATAPELVEDLYPRHIAPVAGLLSRAEILASGGALIDPGAIGELHAAARRTLSSADDLLRRYAEAGFPGCLPVWEVGREVVAPLLREHGRVAVLLVDALRADVAERVAVPLAASLPGRVLQQRWAVVPAPTRTAEAVAALSSGHPVPAGSAAVPAGSEGAAAPLGVPFAQ
ncbi:MAG: DUF6079 family protein, partial [Acidimicrobiales bacterium]